jgi:ribosome-associated protein
MDDWLESDLSHQPGGIELAPGVRVAASALRIQFSRSGGPGGQNVNKVNTKAELWVPLAALAPHLTNRAMVRLEELAGRRLTKDRELHFASETHRSQDWNRQENLERLRELLIRAMAEPKARKKTKPSKAAKQRRLDQKKRRSQIKARRQGRE